MREKTGERMDGGTERMREKQVSEERGKKRERVGKRENTDEKLALKRRSVRTA